MYLCAYRPHRLSATALLLASLLGSSEADAVSWVVARDGTGDFTDIRSAMDAAADGDVVILRPDEYVVTEPIPLKFVTICGIGGNDVTSIRMGTPSDPARGSVFVTEQESFRRPPLRLESVTITGGRGTLRDGLRYGGAIYAPNAHLVLVDCVLTENAVSGSGGGVYAESADLLLCHVIANVAGEDGGGIATISTTATATEFRDNIARRGAGIADWPRSRSRLLLRSCTLTNNFAQDRGGAIFLDSENRGTTVDNGLLFGNAAGSSGGAISTPRANVEHTTIAGNSAPVFGAIALTHGTSRTRVRVRSSIISSNGPDAVDSLLELTHSLTDVPVDSSDGTGNIVGEAGFLEIGAFDFTRRAAPRRIGNIDVELPLFVVEPPDYRLDASSPAIDTAASDFTSDIERNARPCGDGADMGAFEAGACAQPRFLRGDGDSSGVVDISDAIFGLGFLKAGGPLPECLDAADSNGDDNLDISDAVYTLSFLFLGRPAPPSPGPRECGLDLPGEDGLGCEIPSPGCR